MDATVDELVTLIGEQTITLRLLQQELYKTKGELESAKNEIRFLSQDMKPLDQGSGNEHHTQT